MSLMTTLPRGANAAMAGTQKTDKTYVHTYIYVRTYVLASPTLENGGN